MFRLIDLISITLIVLISVLSASAEFPSDIKRCKSDDIECQKNVLQEIIEKYHSEGHRGLNLVRFDPFKVENLNIPKYSAFFVNFELKFKEITLTGISKVKVQKVSGLKEDGPNKFLYELEGNIPRIQLAGPYSLGGNIVFKSITGQGNGMIIFDDIYFKIRGECSIVEKNGKKYLNVDKVHLDLKPNKATFSFDSLGETLNTLINYSWAPVYNELKPVIMEGFGKILMNIVNDVFSKIEYSEIFLPA